MTPAGLKKSVSISELATTLGGKIVIPQGLSQLISINEISTNSNFTNNLEDNSTTSRWCFVAIPGKQTDGHNYIPQAFKNGATFAIVQNESALKGLYPGIVVNDTRAALSKAAAIIFNHPSSKLFAIGVTGTNGKTTVNWMVYHILNKLGMGCARIGTLGHVAGTVQGDTGLTTPDAVTIQKLLAVTLEQNLKAAVLEVSSHALLQHRVSDVEFDIAVYTNLTRDHLDYHDSFEEYKEAKWRLFELMSGNSKKTKSGVINIDCKYGQEFALRLLKKGITFVTYGKSTSALIRIINISQDLHQNTTTYEIKGKQLKVSSHFIGEYNSYNIAALLGVALLLNMDLKEVVKEIANLPAVPGRLEQIPLSESFVAFVDYAHTPDALQNVLATLRPLATGKLVVMFGCGGDRDKGKRPLMRSVATTLADKVIITSDNPRTESAERIIMDVLAGATAAELSKITHEVDRRKAMTIALASLNNGDALIVAGKGHEDYQIIGDTKFTFSDSEELKKCWENMKRVS